MNQSLCGIDCGQCPMKYDCGGCTVTGGRPFGGACILAQCGEGLACADAFAAQGRLKAELIAQINALDIEDMAEVTDLHALRGAFVNLEYTLPGGQQVKFWDDDRIYLGNQVEKKGSGRCYGVAADEHYLLVCEYGENGADAEIVSYKKYR